jgi:hypothetical protein
LDKVGDSNELSSVDLIAITKEDDEKNDRIRTVIIVTAVQVPEYAISKMDGCIVVNNHANQDSYEICLGGHEGGFLLQNPRLISVIVFGN